MNPQVIARKLQAGEIEGYKLGKDWRVSKEQLLRYLERHSNQRAARTPADKTVEDFFEGGKLKPIHSDICTLRRELIINKLMVRSGGKYKVVGWNP